MSRIVHDATVGPLRPGRCPWWWRVDDRLHGEEQRWIERTRLARRWCRYVDRQLKRDEDEYGGRYQSADRTPRVVAVVLDDATWPKESSAES